MSERSPMPRQKPSRNVVLTMARCASVTLIHVLLLTSAYGRHQPGSKAEGSVPTQWRVVWTDTPQSKATIAWSTRSEKGPHRVHYGTRPGRSAGAYKLHANCEINGKYTDAKNLFYHHLRLENLKPDTKYYFMMESGGRASPVLNFRTAPEKDTDFKLLFIGDSRSGLADRRRINQLVALTVTKQPKILALAHGGDYIVSGTSTSQWDQWMTDHELTVTRRGTILPIIPARGNHERSGKQYDEIFGTPGGGMGKNYFATRLSPQVLLVTLNTETTMDGNQLKFLRSTLAANRSVRWQLAQYHRPAWPAVKSPSGALLHWVPTFEEFNIDLACEADGHVLKRTVPIRNKKQSADGVTYIGEGGAGVKQRKARTDRWYLKKPGMAMSVHHIHLLQFSARSLILDALTLKGARADHHVLKSRKR
jgi:hypothetical protein